MTTELLPCPFCGGAPTQHDYREMSDETGEVYGYASVECRCGACFDRPTPEEALAAWSRRAVPTPPTVATLFDAIAHGDEKHRAWLNQAIDDHFAGRPVQRPDTPPTGEPGKLVARLLEKADAAQRVWVRTGGDCTAPLTKDLKEAADRIEALERALRGLVARSTDINGDWSAEWRAAVAALSGTVAPPPKSTYICKHGSSGECFYCDREDDISNHRSTPDEQA